MRYLAIIFFSVVVCISCAKFEPKDHEYGSFPHDFRELVARKASTEIDPVPPRVFYIPYTKPEKRATDEEKYGWHGFFVVSYSQHNNNLYEYYIRDREVTILKSRNAGVEVGKLLVSIATLGIANAVGIVNSDNTETMVCRRLIEQTKAQEAEEQERQRQLAQARAEEERRARIEQERQSRLAAEQARAQAEMDRVRLAREQEEQRLRLEQERHRLAVERERQEMLHKERQLQLEKERQAVLERKRALEAEERARAHQEQKMQKQEQEVNKLIREATSF